MLANGNISVEVISVLLKYNVNAFIRLLIMLG